MIFEVRVVWNRLTANERREHRDTSRSLRLSFLHRIGDTPENLPRPTNAADGAAGYLLVLRRTVELARLIRQKLDWFDSHRRRRRRRIYGYISNVSTIIARVTFLNGLTGSATFIPA